MYLCPLFAEILTDELYFITLVLNCYLFTCRRVVGWFVVETHGVRLYGVNRVTDLNFNLNVSYFTIALTAFSPSTATVTYPLGAAIVASSEERTVLAIV